MSRPLGVRRHLSGSVVRKAKGAMITIVHVLRAADRPTDRRSGRLRARRTLKGEREREGDTNNLPFNSLTLRLAASHSLSLAIRRTAAAAFLIWEM